MPRALSYPLLGALLSIGAPAGFLALRGAIQNEALRIAWVRAEIASQPVTYGYLMVATFAVFVLFGWLFGRKEDELQTLSVTDALTGLWNRRYLRARLSEEIVRASRYGGSVALLLVDLDGLKMINDRRGHAAGDVALRKVAECLASTCRASDISARYGGDEFIVLLPETRAREALEIAERIRSAVRACLPGSPISVSIGAADLASVSAASPDALCEAADHALYEAKGKGRNRVVLARPAAEPCAA
jgi:diguanylate cyclase (GGDEF)-like protein